MSAQHDKTPGLSRCYCEECGKRRWDSSRGGWEDAKADTPAPTSKGLVTELVEALRRNEWVARGHDPEPSCPECTRWQSRGHIKTCSIGLALARATPEAVRKADAAPEMYAALVDALPLLTAATPGYKSTALVAAESARAKAEGKP